MVPASPASDQVRSAMGRHRLMVRCNRASRSSSSVRSSDGSPAWASISRRAAMRASLSNSSSTTVASSPTCGCTCSLRISSVYPRATVSGVRSSCEAKRTNLRWASRIRRSLSAVWRAWALATARRRTCHTMARNTMLINGTSVVSSHPMMPFWTCRISARPVTMPTTTRTRYVRFNDQGCRPYTSDRLIQPRNSQRSARDEAVAHMANRLYEFLLEFGPQPADADIDHVAAGVERVPPYLGEQLVPRAHFAGVAHEVAEQDELPL